MESWRPASSRTRSSASCAGRSCATGSCSCAARTASTPTRSSRSRACSARPTKPHPTVTGDGRAVLPIDSEQGKANSWHTDVTFVDRIPAISVLRAVTLPPYGGTTVWANTVRAYETLPAPLKALAERLRAVHSNRYDYAGHRGEQRIGGVDVKEQAYREEFEQLEFEAEHPVVRVHPETRSPRSCSGTSCAASSASRPLTRTRSSISSSATSSASRTPCAGTGQPGDIAIWDNRATQHYAVADYDDHPRLMHRITLAGDIPVGLDGIPSVALKGDASQYSEVVRRRPAFAASEPDGVPARWPGPPLKRHTADTRARAAPPRCGCVPRACGRAPRRASSPSRR